ncbi:MAG: DUF3301 domain-containing protein [Pseudomonadota bacterium]
MNSLSGTIPFILLLGTVCLWWWVSVQARDRARTLARLFCQRQGWQLLDQTVALVRMRPRRLATGGWRLHRSYRFEYSPDGGARLAGGLILIGNQPQRIWADAPEGGTIEELR